jgi:hypothetical protein
MDNVIHPSAVTVRKPLTEATVKDLGVQIPSEYGDSLVGRQALIKLTSTPNPRIVCPFAIGLVYNALPG